VNSDSVSDTAFAAMIGGSSSRELLGRNHFGSLDSSPSSESQAVAFRYREHLYRPSLTEIAEIETVL